MFEEAESSHRGLSARMQLYFGAMSKHSPPGSMTLASCKLPASQYCEEKHRKFLAPSNRYSLPWVSVIGSLHHCNAAQFTRLTNVPRACAAKNSVPSSTPPQTCLGSNTQGSSCRVCVACGQVGGGCERLASAMPGLPGLPTTPPCRSDHYLACVPDIAPGECAKVSVSLTIAV